MVVELISVGTELLLGNITNTNASYLAKMCAGLGISMYYQSCVGDNEKRMEEVFSTALLRCDIVILSGGLGPTKDDITKEVAAKVMDMPLEENTHTKKRIQEYFNKKDSNKSNSVIADSNWKQALVPKDAIILDNNNGTAPGLILEKNNKIMILLPGPPNELVPMFENQVSPYLRKLNPQVIYSNMVKVCGIGESRAEDMILDLIQNQTNPTIAPYAKTGEVHFRVTAMAKTIEEAKSMIEPVVFKIKERFGKKVYTTEEDVTLEDSIVSLLNTKKLTLGTGESCTGGGLSAKLVNVSGVSQVFYGGVVTYSNEAKMKWLKVSSKTLDTYGAVSEETAREMAKGACKVTGSDVGIGITGIAGPDGGTKKKPVGLVYIACHFKEHTKVKEFYFNGNREKVREQAIVQALILLRNCILE